jgi:hypothetical protein
MGDKMDVWGILVGKPERKRPLGRLTHRRENDIKMYLQEGILGAWTGLIWLRIGTCGGLLYIRLRTFGFYRMWGIS